MIAKLEKFFEIKTEVGKLQLKEVLIVLPLILIIFLNLQYDYFKTTIFLIILLFSIVTYYSYKIEVLRKKVITPKIQKLIFASQAGFVSIIAGNTILLMINYERNPMLLTLFVIPVALSILKSREVKKQLAIVNK